MSSVLNGLIESFVLDQADIIENRAAQFHRLDEAIRATQEPRDHRQRQVQSDFDYDPIAPIYHDGSDFYDHNFSRLTNEVYCSKFLTGALNWQETSERHVPPLPYSLTLFAKAKLFIVAEN